jgi:hypothetical protein
MHACSRKLLRLGVGVRRRRERPARACTAPGLRHRIHHGRLTDRAAAVDSISSATVTRATARPGSRCTAAVAAGSSGESWSLQEFEITDMCISPITAIDWSVNF